MASHNSPPKKPRLSLQIKPAPATSTARPPRGFVSSSDPTSFNTLSNVYVTAIERSSQSQIGEPLTAINTLQSFSITSPLEGEDSNEYKGLRHRVVTPYVANYPETPLSATCASPQKMEIMFPSIMTATPPLSAGPVEDSTRAFSFSEQETARSHVSATLSSPVDTRRKRGRLPPTLSPDVPPPYSHPRSLHSILRNSPLPPRTAIPPPSPRRQSLRLAEQAAKKVEYNNPLTQDIVTNKYIKSHIDLLCEDGSPATPTSASFVDKQSDGLEVVLKLAPNEVQDGGQTPGPYEEMRRRMAGLQSSTPLSGSTPISSPSGPTGIRKRKRKEKKRQWRWTIGQDNEEGEDNISGAEAAVRAAMRAKSEDNLSTPLAALPNILYQHCPDVPTPTIESADSADDSVDVTMSDVDSSSRATSVDPDMGGSTPTGPRPRSSSRALGLGKGKGDTPIPELSAKRDTPIPELAAKRDTPVPPECGFPPT